ncbi:hypothetical protein, partial [Escherichia coli]|uniref:hypothetical protein n=1 Tax=Escherichia coli TaxID=562 RepID=UPI003F461240
QINSIRRDGWTYRFFEQCAASIEEVNRQRATDLPESGNGGFHSIKHPIVPAVVFDWYWTLELWK